jgi:DNA-binding NarL/FixJ family response regulator
VSGSGSVTTSTMFGCRFLNIRADCSDEYVVDERPGITEAEAGTVVAVVVSDPDQTSQLIEGLSRVGFDVTAVQSIREAPDVVDELCPFVVIVDDARSSWLREVADLLHLRPDALPLAVVEVDSPAELLAAVSAGVAGFVSPDAGTEAIARTVRALIDTGVAIPRGLVAALVEEVRRGRGRSVNTAAGPIDVTEREWEILQLMLQRRSTREISEMLFVSVGTVRSHISALGRKLGATDREHTIRLLEQPRG